MCFYRRTFFLTKKLFKNKIRYLCCKQKLGHLLINLFYIFNIKRNSLLFTSFFVCIALKDVAKYVSNFWSSKFKVFKKSLTMETDPVLTNLKLLIIGESGVGKSSLLLRFTDDAFDPEQAATIGVDFKVKTVKIDGNKVSPSFGQRSWMGPSFSNVCKAIRFLVY